MGIARNSGLAGRSLFRGAALLALVAAMFAPEKREAGRDRFVLVDVSASVSGLFGRKLENLPRLIEPALQDLGDGDRVSLWTFSSMPFERTALMRASEFRERMPAVLYEIRSYGFGNTNFETAIHAVLGLIEAERAAEIWMVSDGLETEGSIERVRSKCMEGGVKLFRLPFPATTETDSRLLAVEVPNRLTPGVDGAVRIQAQGDSKNGLSGTLEIAWVRGKDLGLIEAEPFASFPLSLTPGEILTFEMAVRLPEPEDSLLLATLRPKGEDRLRENNEIAAWIETSDSIHVVFWPARNKASGRLPSLLGRSFHAREVSGLDFRDFGFPRLALDASRNEALLRLDAFDENLASLFRDYLDSGGILITAGELANYDAPTGEGRGGVLPFVLDFGDANQEAILLLLDRSGSMSDGKLAEAISATHAFPRSLPANVRLDVALFSERMETPEVWKDWNAEPRSEFDIFPRDGARGGTDLLQVLEQASAHLSARNPSVPRRSIFLLSDGNQTSGSRDPEEFDRLGGRLKQEGVRLVAFAVGKDANVDHLERLTSRGENGKVFPLVDFKKFSDFLIEAGTPSAYDPRPQRVVASPDSPLPGLPEDAPPLATRLRVKLRPGAKALYQTEEGKPVLAMMPVGLGYSVALASPLGPEGSFAWEEDVAIWESLIRTLARQTPRGKVDLRDGAIRFRPEGREIADAELRLSVSDEEWAVSLFPDGESYVGKHARFRDREMKGLIAEIRSIRGDLLAKLPIENQRNPEFWGGGRSVLPFFEEISSAPPPSRCLPFSRQNWALFALALFAVSWLLPARFRLG